MTAILNIISLPYSPFQGTGVVGVLITNGVSNYYKIIGEGLDKIEKVSWYPEKPSTVEFAIRDIILIDPTEGTFMIRVVNNNLDATDRSGKLSFRLTDGSTLAYPVKTYGRLSTQSLWLSPYDGLNTGS